MLCVLFVGNLLLGLIALISQSGFMSAISVIGLPVLLVMWVVTQIFLQNKAWYCLTWAKVTGLTAVKVMTYDHKVKHTLVQLQPDGHWVGPLNWHFDMGNVRLRPDGHVDPDSECSFCYIWQPLDEDLKTQLQLTHWELWPNWQTWLAKSHRDMVMYRASKLNA